MYDQSNAKILAQQSGENGTVFDFHADPMTLIKTWYKCYLVHHSQTLSTNPGKKLARCPPNERTNTSYKLTRLKST